MKYSIKDHKTFYCILTECTLRVCAHVCARGGCRNGTNFTSSVTPACVPSKPILIKVFSQRTHSSKCLCTWHIKQRRKQLLHETPNYWVLSGNMSHLKGKSYMPDVPGSGRWNGVWTRSVRWGPGHAATSAEQSGLRTPPPTLRSSSGSCCESQASNGGKGALRSSGGVWI